MEAKMKTVQLLKWEAIALVESKDDYKEERKKKKEDPGKIKRGLSTDHKTNLPNQAEMLVQRG